MSTTHAKAAKAFLSDKVNAEWHDKTLYMVRTKRDRLSHAIPERIDECCGFGGMFAVEEPEVSACMGRDKVKYHMATGAEYITGADSSCLMHMEGVIEREHLPIRTIHYLEILSAQL